MSEGVAALVVVDVQVGFDDPGWGERNNPACEANVAALIAEWRGRGWPLVYIRHDSLEPGSPLEEGGPGNGFKPAVSGNPDLLISKRVNSAFYGTPDLHAWLGENGLGAVVICGITTNHCCETTARMAANLGYDTTFVLDATHTFARRALDGTMISADELVRTTAANLDGEFGRVVDTATILGEAGDGA